MQLNDGDEKPAWTTHGDPRRPRIRDVSQGDSLRGLKPGDWPWGGKELNQLRGAGSLPDLDKETESLLVPPKGERPGPLT